MSKAEAYVTYRRARVATRRAYRYGTYHGARPYYGGHAVVAAPATRYYGSGYYPHSGGQYGMFHNGYGRGVGWGWGHRWGHGFGWGWHRGWRW